MLLKLAPAGNPAAEARLQREYELLSGLDCAGVLRPLALESLRGGLAIVAQAFAGDSLAKLLRSGPAPLDWSLKLAAGVAEALAGLHERGIVCGGLRPESILVDSKADRVCLANLGYAMVAGRMPPEGGSGGAPDGSLAYLAPEQTGRLEQPPDLRSDLYVLGVILYRLITGVLPFDAEDPLDWMHCHLAREPRPPSELRRELPRYLSDLVMILLAKQPEERYQSARGLHHDLVGCLGRVAQRRGGEDFVLRARDCAGHFAIPARLYGRERELEYLRGAFRQVVESGRPGVVTICGAAGAGKSALARAIVPTVVERGGYFAAGKFDRYQRDLPYAPIVAALRDLARQLLSESEERVAQWRQRLSRAMQGQAAPIVELVPQLSLLLGPQREVPEVAAEAARLRLQRLFQRLVTVVARPAHPLLLLLDDLQWADEASVELAAGLLAEPDSGVVLLVITDRGGPEAALRGRDRLLEAVSGHHGTSGTVLLEALPAPEINRLVADSMGIPADCCKELAQLIHGHTGGNPFFAQRLLRSLYEDGTVSFDHAGGRWRWDLDAIVHSHQGSSVADLLAQRLNRIPPDTRELLAVASLLGSEFDSRLLSELTELGPEALARALDDALERGLVVADAQCCRFAHDRIYKAARGLAGEGRNVRLHLRIAEVLAARAAEGGSFDVANHYNRAAELLVEPAERLRAATFDLRAAQMAMAAADWPSAAVYYTAGDALSDDQGSEAAAIQFELRLGRARCEWILGNGDTATERLLALLQRPLGTLERARAYRCLIDVSSTCGRLDQAVDTLLSASAELFGHAPPRHPDTAYLLATIERTLDSVDGRNPEDLLSLRLVGDKAVQERVALISSALYASWFTDQRLHDVLCCEIVNLSLEHGNCEFSVHGYVTFGRALGQYSGRWELAGRYGALARALADRNGFSASRPVAYFLSGYFGYHCQPWQENVALLVEARRAAREVGDRNIECQAGGVLVKFRLAAGAPLGEVAEEAARQRFTATQVGNREMRDRALPIERLARALQGQDLTAFEAYEERSPGGAQDSKAESALMMVRLYARLVESVVLGDPQAAVGAAREVREKLDERDLVTADECRWFAALADASLAYEDRVHWDRAREALRACQARLAALAAHCPSGFGARKALVAAELERLSERNTEAAQAYEQAVARAREEGLVYIEAIAWERAADFHRKRSFPGLAEGCLARARDAYLRWGAHAKVRRLDLDHPGLSSHGADVAAEQGFTGLDWMAVARSCNAISGEIVLDRLLDTLLRTVLASAGAQRASFLLEGPCGFERAGDAVVDGPQVTVTLAQDRPGDGEVEPGLPESILNYVRRTCEPVLLADAQQAHPFRSDDYLARNAPRSLLCLPVLCRAKLVAALYLEHRRLAGAFTAARMQVLGLLSVQAATALENATLYRSLQRAQQELEQHVVDRTGELREKEQQLVEASALNEDILLTSTVGIGAYRGDGQCVRANQAFADIVGGRQEDMLAQNFRKVPSWKVSGLLEVAEAVLESGRMQSGELPVTTTFGRELWLQYQFSRFISRGEPHLLLMVQDITGRKQSELEQSLAASVFHNTVDGVAITDSNATILSVNPAFTAITGYSAEEAIGRTPRLLRSDRHDGAFYQGMWSALLSKGRWQGEIWNRRKDGEAYLEWLTISVVAGPNGKPERFVAVFNDITELRSKESQIEHMAYHDALTGLANRCLLLDRLNHAIQLCTRTPGMVGVMFIDLDHFKPINDARGHAVGDLVLQEIASRLRESVRSCDTVARLGGDEFVVLVEGLEDPSALAAMADKILEVVAYPVEIEGDLLQVEASLGISVYPRDGGDAEILLRHADAAMYGAKSAGKGCYRYFEPTMATSVARSV